MNDAELNQFIHEKVMGLGEWTPFHHANHHAPGAVKGSRNIQPPSPDYCNDLNAAARAEEKAIGKKGSWAYYGSLTLLCGNDCPHMVAVTAPARLRMEAVHRLYTENL